MIFLYKTKIHQTLSNARLGMSPGLMLRILLSGSKIRELLGQIS